MIPKLHIGDNVKVSDHCIYDHIRGMTAIVMDIQGYPIGSEDTSVVISIPGWHGGHAGTTRNYRCLDPNLIDSHWIINGRWLERLRNGEEIMTI